MYVLLIDIFFFMLEEYSYELNAFFIYIFFHAKKADGSDRVVSGAVVAAVFHFKVNLKTMRYLRPPSQNSRLDNDVQQLYNIMLNIIYLYTYSHIYLLYVIVQSHRLINRTLKYGLSC